MMILLAIVVGYIAFPLMELFLAVIEKLTGHLEKMGDGIGSDL